MQEHRPALGLPADARDSLLVANPGARHGFGADLLRLELQARGAPVTVSERTTGTAGYVNSDQTTGAGEGIRTLDPNLGKVA